jgi:hypothetical protein
MDQSSASARHELRVFVLLAVVPALAISTIFQVHPWPTPMKLQAEILGWLPTVIYLILGGLGVGVLSWTGTARLPAFGDARRWAGRGVISLGVGLLYGVTDLALNRLTIWGAHLAAVDRRNGLSTTFVNVHPPWSLLHYFHASILSECAFRLFPILIPTWLIGGLMLKGRHEPAVYWVFAVLAAMIEPLEKAVFLRKWALFGDTPMEVGMNLEAIAWQVVYAVLLRRFGWPAPIIARFGYYLVVRAFIQ